MKACPSGDVNYCVMLASHIKRSGGMLKLSHFPEGQLVG